jgi:hypothetical protein
VARKRHAKSFHVKNRKRAVEQQKERTPKIETAMRPCERTGGSGESVTLASSRTMIVQPTQPRIVSVM